MTRTRSEADLELQAMGAILKALEGLEGESIQRVIDYVMGRLSIRPSTRLADLLPPVSPGLVSGDGAKLPRQASIRDLKDAKQPKSLNQMAALVAYYLSELAPENERKREISAADLEKYFKQAGFKLPQAIHQTLPNAAAAGYFDGAGGGRYRLNPVGYNLVVHGLPHGQDTKRPARKNKKKGKVRH